MFPVGATASVEAATVQLVPVNITSHLHVEYMELDLNPPYTFTARCSVQHFLLRICLEALHDKPRSLIGS